MIVVSEPFSQKERFGCGLPIATFILGQGHLLHYYHPVGITHLLHC
jgi:hypothetical protein